MRASGLLLLWELWLGAKSVGFISFFLPVTLPSEIPNLLKDLLVRGFPGVWKLFLFHNSLPGTGVLKEEKFQNTGKHSHWQVSGEVWNLRE